MSGGGNQIKFTEQCDKGGGGRAITGLALCGEGNNFSRYFRIKSTCTEGATEFDTFSAGIISGTVEQATGNIINDISMGTLLDTEGTASSICTARQVGGTIDIGSWGVVDGGDQVRVSDLIYMCVDEGVGYVPTETWVDSDGESCECTTDYQVSCQLPQ